MAVASIRPEGRMDPSTCQTDQRGSSSPAVEVAHQVAIPAITASPIDRREIQVLSEGKVTVFKLLIPMNEIDERVSALAAKLNIEYAGKKLVIVGILKGCISFVVDLMRKLDCVCDVEFIRASSYQGVHRKDLHVDLMTLNVKGKEVLLIDDIFDSGYTLSTTSRILQDQHPNSLKTSVLLLKKGCAKTDFKPDHALFEIDDHFVLGYGLDFNEEYRNLKGIYVLDQ